MAEFISKIVSNIAPRPYFALATLGGATQIGSFLFMSCRPRWPRQVQSCVADADVIALNFVNEKMALRAATIDIGKYRITTRPVHVFNES